ncbi:MAG: ADP-ribosylglycohydrolase family protein [Comamonadaceae bacterium]|nr:ADP-ribosylglycohydrolase family protein [Comamonadaceae bacterium]
MSEGLAQRIAAAGGLPTVLDRALGAYLGFAIGDALGATVEFMTPREIVHRWGVHRRIVGGGWLKLRRRRGDRRHDDEPGARRRAAARRARGPALGHAARRRGLRRLVARQAGRLRQHLPPRHPALHRRRHARGPVPRRRRRQRRGDAQPAGGAGDARRRRAVRARVDRPGAHHPPPRAVRRGDAGTGAAGPGPAARRRRRARRRAHRRGRRGDAEVPLPTRTAAAPAPTSSTRCRRCCTASAPDDGFEDAVVAAVNQGEDADTNGALVGMLAGARCGASRLPRGWLVKPQARGAHRRRRAGQRAGGAGARSAALNASGDPRWPD